MNFVRLCVRRPVLTTVIILVILVLGMFSYQRLVVDLLPDVEFPYVTVTSIYPGAGPEEVESQIAEPMEEAVSSISGIKRLDTINREGLSLMVIEFELGVNVDLAAIDVREKIEGILTDLPKDMERPQVAKFDVNALPILNLALTGPQSLRELYHVADKTIRDEISQAPGVASVQIVGGRKREIRVALDPERLLAYGLDATTVANAINAGNLSVPAGNLTEPGQEFTVRVLGEFTDLDQLRNLRIPVGDGSKSVRVADLGRVLDTTAEARDLALLNGVSAVGIIIQKRADANTVATAAAVRSRIAALSDRLPAGAHIVIVRDRSTFIRDAVHDVLKNIFLGIIFTTILLYLFLHSIRTTIIAAVAMPTSIIATFLLIDFAGFTINVMTLLALGISVGVLVTNAIVVLENISRRLDEEGDTPDDAAERGTTEVAVAVAATALTNVVVFTPIAFMSGIIGRFFLQFGMTVVFATAFSLFVSFTLTPMLASQLLHSHKEQERKAAGHSRWLHRLEAPALFLADRWDVAYRRIEESYRRALVWGLGHRVRTTGIVALVFVGSLVLFRFVGGEFMPQSDDGYARLSLYLPAGTTLEQTRGVVEEIQNIIAREVPERRMVLATIGGQNTGVNEAEIILRLSPVDQRKRGVVQIINELRASLAGLPAVEIAAQPYWDIGDEKDIVVEVLGNNMDQIVAAAGRIDDEMKNIPGLADIEVSHKPGKPEITLVPDREEFGRRRMAVAAAGMELRSLYEGDVASVYREAGEEYDIRVRLADDYRTSRRALDIIRLASRDGLVPIDAVGRIERRRGLSEITRKDKERMVSVTASVASGTLVQKVQAIQAGVDSLALPEGLRVDYAGQYEMLGESTREILKALILAIILTYLLLAAILESFVHPFTIMFSLPLGLVGVALALFLTGATMNIFSMMAIVMLVGIVVNNAILILDYARQLRQQGYNTMDAIREAAPARLRPIVMTTLAIIAGIFPQAMGGAGAAYTVAMAVVTMGGVLAAGVLSLFLIPVLYTWFDRLTRTRKRA